MAKRVNKRFLTILTLSVLGLLAAGLVLTRVIGRGNANELAARADECMELAKKAAAPTTQQAKKDELLTPDEYYKQAKVCYAKASKLRPTDLGLLMKYGEARRQLARYDLTEVGKDAEAWRQVVEADPTYLPALQRLLDTYIEYAELRPIPEAYVELGRWAKALAHARQLAKINDADIRPQAYEHIAIIGAWLAGKPTAEAIIEKGIAALTDLMKVNSDEPDVPWFIARARMRMAADRASAGDPEGTRKHVQAAVAAFDEPLKKGMQNPTMLLHFFRAAGWALGLDQERELEVKQIEAMKELLGKVVLAVEPEQRPAAEAKLKAALDLFAQQKAPEGQRTLAELLGMVLERAAKLAKPEQPDYVEIRLAYASLLAREDSAKALASLTPAKDQKQLDPNERWKYLAEQRADDQELRLQVATYLRAQPGKLQEAVELLARPFAPNTHLVGFRAEMIPGLELRRLVELAHLRLEVYREASEGERPAARRQIEDDYARAAGLFSIEHPAMLQLKAKMLLVLDGDLKSQKEAIRLLQRAYDKLEPRGRMSSELAFLLARTYTMVNETGQARSILTALVERQPGFIQPRKVLVQLLLRDQEFAAADTHLKVMEQRAANDPDVKAFRVALLRAAGDIPKARQLAQALPQETGEQKLLKARELMAVGDTADGEKLLVEISKDELQKGAKELPASQVLAQYYLSQKKLPEAKALIDQVLKLLPNDVAWKGMAAMAKGDVKPEELEKLNEEWLAGIVDEASRALYRYRMLLRQGPDKASAALAVLLEAEKKLSDNGPILDSIFNHVILDKKLDRADEYAAKLAKLDWDQAKGLYYQIRLKLTRNDADGALSGALELSRRLPEFSRTWALLGEAQEAAKQFEAAVTSYGKALDKQADNGAALLGMVRCHMAMGQNDVARRYVEQGRKLAATGADFDKIRTWFDERGTDVNALKAVTARREKELEQNRERIELWGTVANDYIRLSSLLNRQDPKAAAEYVEKARALLTDAVKKWPDEPELYRGLSDLLLRSGKPAEGLALLEQLKDREQWKDKTKPWTLLAQYYARLGAEGLAKAEQAWQTASSKAPKDVDLQRQIADFHLRSGQVDKAITLLTAVANETKDLGVRKQLVEVQLTARRFADAEQSLTDLLKATPSDSLLLSLLGYVKGVRGDYAGADEQFKQALKADPTFAWMYYYRGLVNTMRAEPGAAVADLERARDLRPREPDFRSALADAYRRRNQGDEATKELELAVQLAPTREALRLKLLHSYISDQRWMQAQRVLDEAKANPDLNQDPVWWRTESTMCLTQGQLQKAYDAILEARKLAPRDPQLLNDQLIIVLKAEGYDQVIKLTDGLVENNPQVATLWWVFMQRAMARHGQKTTDLAVSEFERAMSAAETVPNADEAAETVVSRMAQTIGPAKTIELLSARVHVRWAIAMARIQAAQKDWPNVIKTMDDLLGARYATLSLFQKLYVLRMCGPVYHAAGTAGIPEALKKAEDTYNRYLAELPKHRMEVGLELEALNNLALLLVEHPVSPNPSRALTYSRRAYEIMDKANSFNPGIADTHGWVLVKCGKLDEGIALLRRAAEKQLVDACYHLGQAYLDNKRPLDAIRSLEQANQLLSDPKIQQTVIDPDMVKKIDAAMTKAKQLSQTGKGKT